MRTVAEYRARRWKRPNEALRSFCMHLQAKHYAKGECRRCYLSVHRGHRDLEYDQLRLLRFIERSEMKPCKFWTPFIPRELPIGGWSLDWLWHGNGIEIGLYQSGGGPMIQSSLYRGLW